MAENKQLLPGDKYTEILEGGKIRLTAKTVQFGSNVFQFHNVTGFGITKVETFRIPSILFLILLLVGWFIDKNPDIASLTDSTSTDIITSLKLLISLIFLFGVLYNLRPQVYGLGLYLNSGHMKVFVTTDVRGLKVVVDELCNYMENNKLGGYVVNIVGGSVTGNYIGGDSSDSGLSYR